MYVILNYYFNVPPQPIQNSSPIPKTTAVAVLVHSGHKSLCWLTPEKKAEAIEHFMEELENVAESDNNNDCTQDVGNISTDVTEKKIAFFNFEV